DRMVKATSSQVGVTFVTDVVAGRHQRNPLARLPRRNRALGVRPHAAGGLLPALELIQDIAPRQGTSTYLLDVEAGGAVALAALRHLAAAAPGVDGVVAQSRPDLDTQLRGPGLGVSPPWEEIVNTVTDHLMLPAEADTASVGPQPNTYREVPFIRPLGPNGTKGHLMEREALSLGMSTTRFSKGAFTASDGVHEPLLFKWSRSPLSSAVSLAMCTHKEATRIR